jgi:Na+-driven multidrug efflux pump
MFNLPIAVVGNLTPGVIPVKILVEYKDTLRNNLSKTFVHDVVITSSWPQPQEKTGINLTDNVVWYIAAVLIVIAAVASVVSAIKIGGRKGRKSSIQSGTPSAA